MCGSVTGTRWLRRRSTREPLQRPLGGGNWDSTRGRKMSDLRCNGRDFRWPQSCSYWNRLKEWDLWKKGNGHTRYSKSHISPGQPSGLRFNTEGRPWSAHEHRKPGDQRNVLKVPRQVSFTTFIPHHLTSVTRFLPHCSLEILKKKSAMSF